MSDFDDINECIKVRLRERDQAFALLEEAKQQMLRDEAQMKEQLADLEVVIAENNRLHAKLAAAEGNPDRDYAWDEMRQQRDAALALAKDRLEEMEDLLARVNNEKARVAALEEALEDVLETACSCHCEEAYTGRGLHAPECHHDEVDGARAVLEETK